MTTIVVDRRKRIMVSDNQNTIETIRTPCRKIFRITQGPNAGTLVGTVGAPGPCFIFMNWYRHHTEHNFEEVMDDNAVLGLEPEDDFWCVLLTPSNKIMIVDRFFCPEEVPCTYYALGSGGNIALGAMDAGASAEEAVEIACHRDTYTAKMGRPLQVVEL